MPKCLKREENKRDMMKRARQILRDKQNPFEISEERFTEIYRMPKNLAVQFINELKPFFGDDRINSVPFHLRVLCALNFYASGSYQRRVGLNNLANLSQSMVSKCVKEISELIYLNLAEKFICFPTIAEFDSVKQRFEDKFGLPNVIGVIDGTHVAVTGLKKAEEHAFINRKGFHSINVQIICDADMKILNANARFPGSTDNDYIWGGSTINTFLEDNYLNRNIYLLGDNKFPLQPWLMTPLKNPITDADKRYNNLHATTSAVIERCIGILKSRFRCILGVHKLRYTMEASARIIYSCIVLHNYLKIMNYEDFDSIDIVTDTQEYTETPTDLEEDEEEEGDVQAKQWLEKGLLVQQNIIDSLN